jgi:GAF domain-containing protein
MTENNYQRHEVPQELLLKWQMTINLVAELFEVPAALIMRVWPEQIEVLVSSVGQVNPYEVHEKADLGTGLYCETVMATREQLLVPNALEDPAWQDNPDVTLDMINYLGVPLTWPDDSIFGTMCVLDSKTRHYATGYQQLLWQLKDIIEGDFKFLELGERKDAQIQELEIKINQLQANGDRQVH